VLGFSLFSTPILAQSSAMVEGSPKRAITAARCRKRGDELCLDQPSTLKE